MQSASSGRLKVWLSELLSRPVRRIKRYRGGRANSVCEVEFADGAYSVLRRYLPDFSPPRNLESIAWEHQCLERLSQAGLHVPLPMPLGTTTVIEYLGTFFSLFSYLPGRPARVGLRDTLPVAAEILASIHNVRMPKSNQLQRSGFGFHLSLDWVAPARPASSWFSALGDVMTADDLRLIDLLKRSLEDATARLSSLGVANHDPVLIHGDLTEHNLLFSGARLSGILDFDLAQVDSPVYDLAVTTYYMCRTGRDWSKFDPRRFVALLTRYRQLRPITNDQLEAIAPYMTVYVLQNLVWQARIAVERDDKTAMRRLRRAPAKLEFAADAEAAIRAATAESRLSPGACRPPGSP